MNTIYFWTNPLQAFVEIRRVLKEDGMLVIGFSPKAVLEKMSVTSHGFTMFELEEVQSLLKSAGFRNVRCTAYQRRSGEFWIVIARK